MNLKPLGDTAILQKQKPQEKTTAGIIIPDSAKEAPQEAVVIAVGPGKLKDGQFHAVPVKAGDKVICAQYAGTKVTYEDQEYLVVNQDDILAIVG